MYNYQVFSRQPHGVQSLIKWQFNEHGGFYTALWKAISKADGANLDRLEMGFPGEVEAYRKYIGQSGWWEKLLAELRGETMKLEVIAGGK